jgi:precorrin-6Y C5,15-methyltransferase (decarboxylating)
MEKPWLTIIGLGENGADGLSNASRKAIDSAEIVMGPPRHLELLGLSGERFYAWPVPFSDGVSHLMTLRGKDVVVLVSGDPFWYGAGTSVTKDLPSEEWVVHPAPSTFGWAAARLGWPLETTATYGLHARPLETIRPLLALGWRAILLLRDGAAVGELARWITEQGFGETRLNVLEALGGPNERLRQVVAATYDLNDVKHPVCVGVDVDGDGSSIPLASGIADDFFEHDGQITKRPVRALTLSALAPKYGEHLWDLGAGSGSISIEWLMRDPSLKATAVEKHPERAARIAQNAARLGQSRLRIVEGASDVVLDQLDRPDVVFVGGGLDQVLLDRIWQTVPVGTRFVMNSVTLESDAVLIRAHADKGGDLMRFEIAATAPIGPKRGWKAAFPISQWCVTK